MDKLETLEDFFQHKLQSLHDIETQLVSAIPIMEQAATALEIKTALQKHLDITRSQQQRVEDVSKIMGFSLTGTSDQGIAAIIKEGESMLKLTDDPQIKDEMILSSAAKIEHYEEASYRSAITLARKIEENAAADILEQTFKEESQAASEMEQMAKES